MHKRTNLHFSTSPKKCLVKMMFIMEFYPLSNCRLFGLDRKKYINLLKKFRQLSKKWKKKAKGNMIYLLIFDFQKNKFLQYEKIFIYFQENIF